MCHAQIAMLGESATHGDGHTVAFKVALVERLVDQCGFDNVFFEANHDEFIHLNERIRDKQSVTPKELLTAVGGIWKFDREFQPLAPFLLSRAQRGQLYLGGLDDQLGQFEQDYTNVEMIAEWTNLLPQPERQSCSTALHNRFYLEYPEAAPYSREDRSRINTCLSEIQAASAAGPPMSPHSEERLEMICDAQRWVSRDFTSNAENMVNRDRSMFQNFQWLQSRTPSRHKVIVWAATVHIAKQASPSWGDHAGTNFGSFIHQRYGEKAYSLGFSALSGSYRQGQDHFPAMPTALPDSVERRALHNGSDDARYVATPELAAMGTSPGAFFIHSYQTLTWSDYLDGVVVFQTEQPPIDTRPK